MDFNFLRKLPFSETPIAKNDETSFMSTTTSMVTPASKSRFEIGLWGWSFLPFVPWLARSRERNSGEHSVLNKKLREHARSNKAANIGRGSSKIRFRPYASKVPWHTGPRALLSHLFPRYGHYCGPNWSSGKAGGSHIWDQRPIDWLDFCCYCHDIGYDTHDQAELLKADLAFLECLERPNMDSKGDAHAAFLYRTMCISGLRNILIPYRANLLKLQSRELSLSFGWLSNVKWKGWSLQRS